MSVAKRMARRRRASRAASPPRRVPARLPSWKWKKKWIWSFSDAPSTVEAIRIVATLSGMPSSRIARNIARMANTDGIIAMIRAAPLRKTKERDEDDDRGQREALDERRHQVVGDLLVTAAPGPTTRTRLPASAGCVGSVLLPEAHQFGREVRDVDPAAGAGEDVEAGRASVRMST